MIVAGFGFRSGASPQSLADALSRAAGEDAGEGTVDCLATVEEKASGEPFGSFARALGLRIHAVGAHALEDQVTTTQSTAALAARGTGSVAEASALAAAGPGARLLAPRAVSADGMATCALATRAAVKGSIP
ncbi:MAG: cobalamin biosynthesis protein [Pseudomonadota bacterium]